MNGEKSNCLYDRGKVILKTDGQEQELTRKTYGINLIAREAEGETAYYL